MPCKRSSAVLIPFGFRLSVVWPRHTALPAPARSFPCDEKLFYDYLPNAVILLYIAPILRICLRSSKPADLLWGQRWLQCAVDAAREHLRRVINHVIHLTRRYDHFANLVFK